MGADTSATHMIFFVAAMIIASGVVSVVFINTNAMMEASREGVSTVSEQIKTDITIINDPSNIPQNGDVYTFYVKNIGKSDLAFDQVTVLIDGDVILNNDLNKTIIGGNTTWYPSDVLQLDVTYASMPAGDNTIKVITENGIDDSLEFHI